MNLLTSSGVSMIPLAIALFVLALVVVPPKLLVAVTPLRLTKSKGPFSCRLDVSVDVCVPPKLGTGEVSSDTDATAVDGSPPVVPLLDGLLPLDVWSSSLFSTIVSLPDADLAGAGGGGP